MKNHQSLICEIKNQLSTDLLLPAYQKDWTPENPHFGFCSIASEALFFLMGGLKSGLKAQTARDEDGIVHWWLKTEKGEILDPTSSQYTLKGKKPPYEKARGGGFMGMRIDEGNPWGFDRKPSIRASKLLKKIIQARTVYWLSDTPVISSDNSLPRTWWENQGLNFEQAYEWLKKNEFDWNKKLGSHYPLEIAISCTNPLVLEQFYKEKDANLLELATPPLLFLLFEKYADSECILDSVEKDIFDEKELKLVLTHSPSYLEYKGQTLLEYWSKNIFFSDHQLSDSEIWGAGKAISSLIEKGYHFSIKDERVLEKVKMKFNSNIQDEINGLLAKMLQLKLTQNLDFNDTIKSKKYV